MKLFTGWVLVAGLALTATTASAQMGPSRVSDFTGPYVEGPYRGPYYAPPPVEVAPPPPRYGYGGYGYGYAPAALLPPHEVYNIIREAGFSPLGIPRQRGFIYTIAVIDRGGEDGRLVIDARSGRILRFVPAWQHGAPYGAWNSSYGPPGPLPPAPALRSSLNPPAPAPQVASRSVPVPKPNPLAAKQAEPAKPAVAAIARPSVEAAAKPAPEPSKPATEAAKPAPQPPTQQAAATPAKPADTAPATTGTIGQTQAKPAPTIQPTQEMPKAQGLE
ncbi:MAG: hypothetical protein GY844_07510 [Bradyrhizobium sp.]|nr:hypothetical protein [Bradyrhizobium sp.]